MAGRQDVRVSVPIDIPGVHDQPPTRTALRKRERLEPILPLILQINKTLLRSVFVIGEIGNRRDVQIEGLGFDGSRWQDNGRFRF